MLRARVWTALVLVTVFGGVLFAAADSGWLVFCAVVAALAAWEWTGLVGLAPLSRAICSALMLLLVSLLAPGGMLAVGMAPSLVAFAASGIFWTLVVPVWLRDRWPLPQGAMGVAVGLLVVLPAALALYVLRDYGPCWLLAVMAAVWIADIAAYFVGRRFGRTKLAPLISPGKSREGAYGGIAGVCIYALAVVISSGAPSLSLIMLLGLLLASGLFAVVSILGDLFESLAKRQAGVKDSGSLLPGHGGVLDRIDSLTSTLPITALTAHFLFPPL